MKRAVIVGSGPNGLSAAIALARAGVHVTVFEAADVVGGAVRTEALTLPGFLHDVGAAVFPLGLASPFFRSLPLAQHGLRWIEPDVPLAHPLGDGDAVGLLHSLDDTAALLGVDGAPWRKLVAGPVAAWPSLIGDALSPLLHWPQSPVLLARFGIDALLSAERLSRNFKTQRARTLFAGLAGHGNVPLHFAASSGAGAGAGCGSARGWLARPTRWLRGFQHCTRVRAAVPGR